MITSIRIRVEKEVVELFKEYCKSKGKTLSQVLRELIYRELEEGGVEYKEFVFIGNSKPRAEKNIIKEDIIEIDNIEEGNIAMAEILYNEGYTL